MALFCAAAMVCSACAPAHDGDAKVQPAALPTDPASPDGRPARGAEPERFQAVSGLGVNANVHSWKDGQLKPAIDAIAELGDVTWRVIIDKADWETDPIPGSANVMDPEHDARIYEVGKMADLWNTVAYINSKPDQQVMVSVMGGVPGWMGGDHIDESSEDQWVQMVASMAAYGRTVRGLDFKLLSPMNETDWNGIEGPRVDPEQYVRLLRKLIIRLDSLGLTDIRLVGPDTASVAKATSDYLPALARDGLVMSRLAHFAIHSYDGDSAGTAESLAKEGIPSAGFWVTEFSGPCPGCDSGLPNPADWPSAASNAAYAIRLLQQGASGLQQYDAWDGYYEHHESMGYWGLLAYDPSAGTYSPRKSYFVLQQLIKYTPRNSIRLAASSGEESTKVVAFDDPLTGRITVFGLNTSDQTATVELQVPGVRETVRLETFATNTVQNMQRGDPAVLANGRTWYTAPPGAVFTLTGSTLKGTAP